MKARTEKERVIIVGAGVSGLAAGSELARAGHLVTLLEARSRAGGRLFTLHPDQGASVPIDLGPEFLHGEAPEVRRLLGQSSVKDASEGGWMHWRGARLPGLHDEFGHWLKMAHCSRDDRPLEELFSRLQLDERARASLLSYVEGFNALEVAHASQSAFRRETDLADEEASSARPLGGYDELLAPLERDLGAGGGHLALETRVHRIEWERGRVRVFSESSTGPREDEAERLIFTLPPSLLVGRAGPAFLPELPEKRRAASLLPLGSVHKVVFLLKEPLWDTEGKDLSFLHAPEALFGARWIWSLHARPVFVCWSGGTRARALDGLGRDEVIERALDESAALLGVSADWVRGRVEGAYYHDWVGDPFARGAYAFVRTGGYGSREELARPVDDTLFFAGEATVTDGAAGTVHGALRSGYRAAREILERRAEAA